jgi:excisionase family DNA binding protein
MSRFRPQAAKEASIDSAPRFYSASDLAAMFGVCRMTVYRALDDGDIPAIRIRGRWIVPARAVDEMVEAAIAGRFVVDDLARVAAEPRPPDDHGTTNQRVSGRPRPGANQTGAGSPITQLGARGDASSMTDPGSTRVRGRRASHVSGGGR